MYIFQNEEKKRERSGIRDVPMHANNSTLKSGSLVATSIVDRDIALLSTKGVSGKGLRKWGTLGIAPLLFWVSLCPLAFCSPPYYTLDGGNPKRSMRAKRESNSMAQK